MNNFYIAKKGKLAVINNISNVSFGSLKIGYSINQRRLRKTGLKQFERELSDIKKIIKEHGWQKQRNVNIILQTERDWRGKDVFSCIIESKKQGTPYNPDSEFYIGKDKRSISRFDKWIKEWNENYSPEALERWHRIKEQLSRPSKILAGKLEWDN